MKVVTGEEDVMIITTGGVLIRMAVSDISTMGRSTQGVRLIKLNESDNEFVATVAKVEKEDEEVEMTEEGQQASSENDADSNE